MIKIVAVCGAGVGSSMMLRLYTQQICDAEGIQAEVDAADIGSVNANEYDIVITTGDFTKVLRNNTASIIEINNLMDKEYLKHSLLEIVKKG